MQGADGTKTGEREGEGGELLIARVDCTVLGMRESGPHVIITTVQLNHTRHPQSKRKYIIRMNFRIY